MQSDAPKRDALEPVLEEAAPKKPLSPAAERALAVGQRGCRAGGGPAAVLRGE